MRPRHYKRQGRSRSSPPSDAAGCASETRRAHRQGTAVTLLLVESCRWCCKHLGPDPTQRAENPAPSLWPRASRPAPVERASPRRGVLPWMRVGPSSDARQARNPQGAGGWEPQPAPWNPTCCLACCGQRPPARPAPGFRRFARRQRVGRTARRSQNPASQAFPISALRVSVFVSLRRGGERLVKDDSNMLK